MTHARLRCAPPWLLGPAGAVALALTTACASGQSEPAAPPPPPASLSRIQTLIGSAACESDAQCRTVPIGAKACGGPEGWLAWSVAATDGAALQVAADRQARAARKESAARGMASNCAVVVDPGAWCAPAPVGTPPSTTAGAARVCRLRSARPGGAGAIY